MDKLKKAFGYSDPLAQAQAAQIAQYQRTVAQYQNVMGQLSSMGMVNAQANTYSAWGHGLTQAQIRDKTRAHIAEEVEKMAEEIGAPTLLHAVVLAIRTMEIPE